jgi:signal transduction histidine kinase
VSDNDTTSRLQVEYQQVLTTDIVNETVSAFPDLSNRFSFSDVAFDVKCDQVRAVQCLSNLLSNAGKYSEPRSAIKVETSAPEGESWVSIDVIDSGRGIPSDELARVFERFYRVEDPMTMTTGGSGLGLFISRELARAMGGDITAESTIGKGSRFSLRLPRWAPTDEAT